MLLPTRKTFGRPGPTVQAYMDDITHRVVGIMGPQGGGKTTGLIGKVLKKSALQPPSPVDGIAYYRAVVWMRTYRELWAKFVSDWLEWLPQQDKGLGITWNGGRDNPAEQSFRFQAIVDGQAKECRAEVWFRAIGEQTPQEAAKGLHMTDGILPEATSATFEMFEAMFGRIGRYPRQEHGGAPFRQVMCDWNAGDPYNWTSEFFIYNLPPQAAFYRQPGGREPNAENIENLPPGYYDDQVVINAHNPDWLRRMIDNEIGFIRDGKPVYEAFSEGRHVNYSGLTPWPGVPLIIAADAGLQPAITVGQRNDFGEWRVLDELTFEPGTGARRCGEALNALLGSERYARVPRPETGYADPSAKDPHESSDETETATLRSWMSLMASHTGIRWVPAKCGNSLEMRQEGVRVALNRSVQGRAAVQIDGRRCPGLIKALARDYKFRKVASAQGHGVVYHEKPDKGPASHVANAAEYMFGSGGEQDHARGEEERRRRAAKRYPPGLKRPNGGPIDPLKRYRRAG